MIREFFSFVGLLVLMMHLTVALLIVTMQGMNWVMAQLSGEEAWGQSQWDQEEGDWRDEQRELEEENEERRREVERIRQRQDMLDRMIEDHLKSQSRVDNGNILI